MATAKQKKAMEILVENGGNNVGKAMIEAGYTPATAKTPQKLTESKGWQELVEEYLPDDLLAKVTKEGLLAGRKTTDEETGEEVVEPDFNIRHRYLETALKVRDKFPNKLNALGDGAELAILGVTYVTPTTDKPESTETGG